jgi:hypothetical protein
MFTNRAALLLLSSALLAFPCAALAQTSTQSDVPTDRLVQQYTSFAGSETNAESLVTGLRDGTPVTLSSSTSAGTAFTPPTGKMGVGNVNIALALAEASLKQQGITNPTPAQLQAALTGGTVNGAKFVGVLTLRAEGKGWGEIANSLGFKLGDVVRSAKAEGRDEAARADKPARPEKPERPERVDRGGR